MECCADCKFSMRLKEPDMLECRRNAPPIIQSAATGYSTWPRTKPNDWCGEFQVATADERKRRAA